MSRNVKISAALVAAFVVAVAAIALAAGGGEDGSSTPAEPEAPQSTAGSGEASGSSTRVVAPDPRRLGEKGSSDVTFTEFLDFECEACGAAFPVVEQLRREYAGRVTFNVRYFPLPSHGNSRPAALAVEAAAQQGKFEAMYKRMFETQASWGEQTSSKAAVFRGYADPHGTVAELEHPDAVHAPGSEYAEALARLGQHLLSLGDRQGLVGLVLETLHGMPLVLVAHPALERTIAAGGRVGQRRLQVTRADGRCTDLDHVSLLQRAGTAKRCRRH